MVVVTISLWILVAAYALEGIFIVAVAFSGPASAGTVGVLGLAWKVWRRLKRRYKVWKS